MKMNFSGCISFGSEADLEAESLELADSPPLDGSAVAFFEVAYAEVLVISLPSDQEIDDCENFPSDGDDSAFEAKAC